MENVTLFQIMSRLTTETKECEGYRPDNAVSLPHLTELDTMTSIDTKQELKEYASGFVERFGQCMFNETTEGNFEPVSSYKFRREKRDFIVNKE